MDEPVNYNSQSRVSRHTYHDYEVSPSRWRQASSSTQLNTHHEPSLATIGKMFSANAVFEDHMSYDALVPDVVFTSLEDCFMI